MFNEMTAAIREDTVRMILHVRIEQKVEREEVAKVTGTNRDDSAKKGPVRRQSAKIGRNDPCHVAVARNIRCAAAEICKYKM